MCSVCFTWIFVNYMFLCFEHYLVVFQFWKNDCLVPVHTTTQWSKRNTTLVVVWVFFTAQKFISGFFLLLLFYSVFFFKALQAQRLFLHPTPPSLASSTLTHIQMCTKIQNLIMPPRIISVVPLTEVGKVSDCSALSSFRALVAQGQQDTRIFPLLCKPSGTDGNSGTLVCDCYLMDLLSVNVVWCESFAKRLQSLRQKFSFVSLLVRILG